MLYKHSKTQKPLHTFSSAAPDITAEPLSDDPKNKNFLCFRLLDSNTGAELSRYRADDIVQMRKFMASLGNTGQGLFTKKTEESVDAPAVEATHGLWDVVHPSEDELSQRQEVFDRQERTTDGAVHGLTGTDAQPTYVNAISHLAIGFYFPPDVEVRPPPEMGVSLSFPSSRVPLYNPSAALPKAYRRPYHDTFRPPYGPPVFFPVSIGYGSEVGLQPGQQALWEPNLKTYFFVDHVRQVIFYDDPRPPKEPYPVVPKLMLAVGDRHREGNMSPNVCRNADVVKATAQRALSKPHGFTVRAHGVNGAHGANGQTGETGSCGLLGHVGIGPGGSGGRGGDGGPGGRGSDGVRGKDATEASDVALTIWGDANKLHATGTCTFTANLGGPRAEEVVFLNCRGGDGGNGGRGGDGGLGGSGGMGGLGAQGFNGMSSCSGPGGNGGPGGHGGNGGDGGPGGQGGRGGDAGSAGFGGGCIVQSVDPKLLVLVEADCREGIPGVGGGAGLGGHGGRGGLGGVGGIGGFGGSGGSTTNSNGVTTYYPRGMNGMPGINGIMGDQGPRGMNGSRGANGQPAPTGGILWVVHTAEGGVLFEAATRYDAEVTELHIASAIDDGIFEPNEMIMVSGVLVVNSGGLPLPAGSSAFMPSTKTIKFQPTTFDVPELVPGQSFVIPVTYHGRIFDQPPPNVSGPFVSSAEFHPRIELLGRPFEKSFLHQKLTVQYPVKLAHLKCNENLGRGEVSVLEIGVQNISRMPYGDAPDSGGKVALQIHLDARIIPIGYASISLTDVPYTVSYDPAIRDSMYVQMHAIPPGEVVVVKVAIQMESRAELFDRCLWQADLYLRDKLIEYNTETIRVSPFYTPGDPTADVLMVTSKSMSRKEFVFWQRLLEALNVKVDFWDVDRYHGLSVDSTTNARHPVTWLGRYSGKLILYPYCDLHMLLSGDLVAHFHGTQYASRQLEEKDSSMVLLMHPHAPHVPQASKFYDRGDNSVIRHLAVALPPLELPENAYSGIHLLQPGTCITSATPFLSWEKKQLKKLEEELPSQSVIVISRQPEIRKVGFLRYSYGAVDIRRIPILRSSKLLVVDGAGGTMTQMSLDDTSLSPRTTELPLASQFGQVFLTTLYGLPLAKKLALVKTGSAEPSQLQLSFHLPSGTALSKAELCMISAVAEIADEVLNCTGEALRMGRLVEDVTANVEAYQANGQAVFRSMGLLKEELKVRKKRLSNSQVSRAVSVIKGHASRVERILRQAGVDSRGLPPLPSFSILRDSYRVHHTAQHRVADRRWNLLGQ